MDTNVKHHTRGTAVHPKSPSSGSEGPSGHPGPALRGLLDSLLGFFLPRSCAGCQKQWLTSTGVSWCPSCLDRLPWLQSPICPCCGVPFTDSPSAPDHLCGDCLRSRFHFETARSAVNYSGAVRERIHQLKFGCQLHWVPPLVDLLVLAMVRHGMPTVDLVIPVPLHVRRLRQRGFNQAGLLAGEVSRRLGWEASLDNLVRKSWTVPQTRLHRAERLTNVKDAFALRVPERVDGRRVLLIDDVFTTGSTLNECAAVLKDAGASAVHALTVARALPDWKPVE